MIGTKTEWIQELRTARQELLAKAPELSDGLSWCRAYSDLGDSAVRRVATEVLSAVANPPRISVVATGGYGRREMAPYSDFDLVVIPLDEAHPNLDELIRALYRGLHEAMEGAFQAEVGYAYRLVNDAPGLDGKSRSSMIDARLVAGSKAPLKAFQDLLIQTFPTGDFLIDKIREREARMREFHDTPLVVEPHLKEGAGGIRSRHAANWIRQVISMGALPPSPSYDAILRARNILHFVAGKRVDLLSRQRQAEVADCAGLELDPWLADVARHMEVLHEEYRTAVRLIGKAPFRVAPGVTSADGQVRFSKYLDLGTAAMGVALATTLELELAHDEFEGDRAVDGPEALRAISYGEATLRNLDRSGVLARILPEVARCRTLMPEDATHTYTVFEHTLRAIRNLDGFGHGTFLGELKQGLSNAEPLYLALVLHDVGKGTDHRPHAESGADIAERVCARWKLSPSISRLVAWLVREHLTLARYIRMRDIQNPHTAAELAEAVSDRERLDMLALLTVADIRAVSADAWTPAMENLLRELWKRTAEILDTQARPEHDPALHRKRLKKALETSADDAEQVERFLSSLPAHYVISTPPALVAAHLAFAEKAIAGEPTIEIAHLPAMGSTELTVCCRDAPGLLSRLLGVLYAWDLSVQTIRVSTAALSIPIALDTFAVSFNGQPLPPATCQHATLDLLSAIKDEIEVGDLLQKHGKDAERPQGNFTYVFIEGDPGILEIRAPRGRGMAYRMSRLIARQGWDIVAARIGQWAGQGAAAFYIQGPGHCPLSAAEVKAALGSPGR